MVLKKYFPTQLEYIFTHIKWGFAYSLRKSYFQLITKTTYFQLQLFHELIEPHISYVHVPYSTFGYFSYIEP